MLIDRYILLPPTPSSAHYILLEQNNTQISSSWKDLLLIFLCYNFWFLCTALIIINLHPNDIENL